MDKLKKIIIIMIVVLAILGIIIASILRNTNKGEEENQSEFMNEYTQIEEIEVDTGIQEEKSPTKYYAIKRVIDQYYGYMAKFNPNYNAIISGVVVQEETENERKYALEALKQVMNNYIKKTNIIDENLKKLFEQQANETFNIEMLYYRNDNENTSVYYAKGKLTKSNEEGYIIIIIDNATNGYTILPLEYVKEKFGKNIDVSNITLSEELMNIETRAYNKITYNNVSDQEICMYYFGDYMYNLKTDIKTVYNTLNDEYKKKRFGNYEKFKKYIEDNYKNLTNMTMKEYQIYNNTTDETTMYLCKDGEGHCYIFNASAVMNYTLMLDSYTIDLPEFTQKYNEATEEQKVGYNIEKVFNAINDKNYQYVYNKLDNTFRTNNFKTEDDLKKYIKNTFFTNNTIQHESCEKNGNLYMYKIIIKDSTGEKQDNITKTIIMQLKEGTDFVMSFNVE